jgi:uncharacterized OB-fold protein
VTEGLLLPVPTPESQPFWDGCARGELLLPRCTACRRFHFFPRSFCPHCWSEDLAWEPVSGRGVVVSFVRSLLAPAGFDLETPVVIALVELEEGVRLMSNVIVPDPLAIEVGTQVQAVFRDAPALLRFVPAEVTA